MNYSSQFRANNDGESPSAGLLYDLRQIGHCKTSDILKSIVLFISSYINLNLIATICYALPIALLLSLVPISVKSILYGIPFGIIDGFASLGYFILWLFNKDAFAFNIGMGYNVTFWTLFILVQLGFIYVAIFNLIYGLARSSNRYRNSKTTKPLSQETKQRIRDSRIMKIFISSTFADLEIERDHLMQQVFPQINSNLRKRGITLIPIDLRWGIPLEEAYTQNIFIKCLDAIDECNPFIIGISADRYGWVPTPSEFPDKTTLYQKFPWIKKELELGKSITEIEITYGALNKRTDVYGAFFFETDSFGNPKLFGIIDSYYITKKSMMRRRILDNPRLKTYTFSNKRTLGHGVEKFIYGLVNDIFGEEKNQDTTHADTTTEASVQLINSNIYIHRPDTEQRIKTFLKSQSHRILIISGMCGIGKTSTALRCLEERKAANNATYSYFLFSNSSNINFWKNALETKNQAIRNIETAVFDLEYHFTGKIEFILTHLSQTFGRDGNLKIIILIDEQNDTTTKLKLSHPEKIIRIRMSDFTMQQRQGFISKYLSQSGKKIIGHDIVNLCSAPFSGIPLCLKTALDILITFGNIKNINDLTNSIINAKTPYDIFYLLIDLYKNQFFYREYTVYGPILYLHHHGPCTLDYKKIREWICKMFDIENCGQIESFINCFPGFNTSDRRLQFANEYIAECASHLKMPQKAT